MTPERLVDAIEEHCKGRGMYDDDDDYHEDGRAWFLEEIGSYIRDAVAAERERCAAVARMAYESRSRQDVETSSVEYNSGYWNAAVAIYAGINPEAK